jgi:hypothetical protein
MIEPPVIAEAKRRKKVLVASLALAAFVALVLTGGITFFLLHQKRSSSSTNVTRSEPSAEPRSPFLDVPESAIPGRYRRTHGPERSFIVLYDDHTFMNRDGTIFPQYRWDIGPEGLVITWQKSYSRFTNIEAPGVYTLIDKGQIDRIEKLPPYEPAQLKPPTPVASIRLGAQCETNGLTPMNTGGDGAIRRGKIDEVECYRLVRQQGRNSGYLYLQIAPEHKEPPFTNALVLIEYFDAAPTDAPPGRLGIHFDAEYNPYANAQPLDLTGSETWQEATFYLARPLFQGRQNAGADFRLYATAPQLFVRSVKLVKNPLLPERKLPTSVAIRE